VAAPEPQISTTTLVHARLLDFFGHRTPWHRRLWNVGTCLALRETVEYADACIGGSVPNTEGLRFVLGTAKREVGRDPGAAPLADQILARLDVLEVTSPSKVSVAARDELDQLVRRLGSDYLQNWTVATTEPPVEFTARALAAHLLDLGFSPDHLHRWVTAIAGDITSLSQVTAATMDMVTRMPIRTYNVFVPCAAPFDKPAHGAGRVRWLDGNAAATWLRDSLPGDESRRHAGGFLLEIEGRDPWSAVEESRVTVARAEARAKVTSPSNETIRLHGWARVAGDQRSYQIRPTPRQIEIGSLVRQDAVYRFDDGLPAATDDALELASYMESPSAGAAVTGGWSAIEALLIRPGEGSHHLAADRLASLIACSLPRAELTPLAYRHLENANDDLARALTKTHTNFDKVELVESHLRTGGRLDLTDGSDVAAQDRIVAIIQDPAAELGRIKAYVTESLRRLYNQRNTVAHAGSLRSAALTATTRTALSLVGAGLDRIVHAQLGTDGDLPPLSLVARAEVELNLVGSTGGRTLSSLLE
jgi:hypothetical protein